MPTRNINLTDRYDAYLTRQVAEGRFKNVSEAVRAALHMMEAQDRETEAKLEALRRDVGHGLDAYRARDFVELADDAALESFFAEIANGDTATAR